MSIIACPHCLARYQWPEAQPPAAFTCSTCGKVVGANAALPGASESARLIIGLLALFGGFLLAGADGEAVRNGAAANRCRAVPGLDGFAALAAVVGGIYLLARCLYTLVGARAEVEQLRAVRGGPLAVCSAGGSLLVWAGIKTFLACDVIRPGLLVGGFLLGFLAFDVLRSLLRTPPEEPGSPAEPAPRHVVVIPDREPPPECSRRVGELLAVARVEAAAAGQDFVGTDHLLLAVALLAPHQPGQLLATAGATPERVRAAVLPKPDPAAPKLPSDSLPLTPAVRRAFLRADALARTGGLPRAEPDHLLLSLLADTDGSAVSVLLSLGADVERLKRELAERTRPGAA